MTITFNPWRAFWLLLWLTMGIAGLVIVGGVPATREYWGGFLIGYSATPWTLFLLFHDIRRRKP